MSNRPTRPPKNSGPPPLPFGSDERERLTAVTVAVAIAFGLLLLLLLLFWLGRSRQSTIATVVSGGRASSGADTDSADSVGTKEERSDAARGSERKEQPHESSADQLQDTNGHQPIDRQAPSKTTAIDAPLASVVTSDTPDTTTRTNAARKSAGTEAEQPLTGNHFFTLGDTTERPRPVVDNGRLGRELAPTRDAFTGRTGNGKEQLLRDYGGTAATEAAVKLGLGWLARNQQENGLWSLTGPYSDAGAMENSAAATAMALLAFQGAGHTHRGDRNEPYTKVVARGSKALLTYVSGKGAVNSEGDRFGGYAPALCTIALCELYGMTHDRNLRAPALRAIEYCLDAQSPQGGWRYVPMSDSDTSVTGWFLMGLQSAQMAGVKVPKQTFSRASSYLDMAANTTGARYSYQPGLVPTQSMTAEALLCRQYLGWRPDEPRLQNGVGYLLEHLPSWDSSERDVYYWYYATQVCHHMGGDQWQKWNEIMREILPAKQIKDGPERGSWEAHGDRWGSQGGRLYVTCMSLYILEVYYRYLPLYREMGAPH